MTDAAPVSDATANDPTSREAHAMAVVRSYMGWSAGAGLLPMPGLDMAAIVAVQVKMLQSMATLYGVPFRSNMVKPAIVALVSGGSSVMLAISAASLAKAVPLIGSIAGMLAVPAMAAASCYATGKVFIQHFESGGTLLDFDPAKVRAYYAEQFNAAKGSQG